MRMRLTDSRNRAPSRPVSASLATTSAHRRRLAMLNDFELERQRRIEENKRRMAEMGIAASAAKLTAVAEPVPAPQVRAVLSR